MFNPKISYLQAILNRLSSDIQTQTHTCANTHYIYIKAKRTMNFQGSETGGEAWERFEGGKERGK